METEGIRHTALQIAAAYSRNSLFYPTQPINTQCIYSSCASTDRCKFINKLPIADNARVDV
jgi:hypothetical protein